MTERPDAALAACAVRHGLIRPGETSDWRRLTGGVSSEVWRLSVGGRDYALKRALARLTVAADWRAPTDRSLYEWRWFETVRGWFPESAPEPVMFDPEAGVLAMRFLPPEDHPLWKAELVAGRVDPGFAGAVGARIGAIHARSARDETVAARFDADLNFFALRLEPFLLTPARRHPDLANVLQTLSARTAGTRLALVHGDVSPKNILCGPSGPVFLDAETAWYGDPAFDLAFCTMHLMLKHLAVPARVEQLSLSIQALAAAYLRQVAWEAPAELEARAAALVPALMLARVDGKSPVDYLPGTAQQGAVRDFARTCLTSPSPTIEDARRRWRSIIDAGRAGQGGEAG